MPVRRRADPASVQHVWDAIRAANAQRQMADQNRIVKYLQRVEECSQAQAEMHLQQALLDGLIFRELHKVTAKGAHVGMEVESYKLPLTEQPAPEDDGKDWYCIDCHLAGDVILCPTCHRVFHAECAHKKKMLNDRPSVDDSFQVDRKRNSTGSIDSPDPKDGVAATDRVEESEYQVKEDKTVDLTIQDESLSRLVDDVEKKLEKMQESEDENNSCTFMSEPVEVDKNCSNLENGETAALPSKEEKVAYDINLCSVCNMFQIESELSLEKEELNYLLSFVFERIKSWVPLSITDPVPPESKAEWLTEAETNWRAKQLFYQPMNMVLIGAKLQTQDYANACQFKADVLTVRHNVAIYHGIESQEFDCADYLWKDCHREIKEMSICIDCYRHSNEKINNKWFCLPCRVPHRLVWAKQKGYPYWPAKVIRETEDSCDVRFFGAKYERAILQKNYVKSITVDIKSAQGKKNAALIKATEELHLHQKILENPSDIQKFLVLGKKRKASLKPVTNPKKPKIKKINQNKSPRLSKDEYEMNVNSYKRRRRSSSPLLKAKQVHISELRRSLSNQSRMDTTPTLVKNGNMKEDDGILNISSDPEEQEQFSFSDDYQIGQGCDSSQQEVSSSTEQGSDENYIKDGSDGGMPQPERQYSEAVERTRRKLELCRDKKELIKVALESMQAEIDAIKNAHDDYLKKVFESHNAQISETKKKQWCYNCEQDAIYHCCWNTAYCSPTCQQQHWLAEHKKVCRRKR